MRRKPPLVERLTITDLGHRADGVAQGPDGAVYIPYTLPGEVVEAEAVPGHPDRRHLLHVDVASPERIAPICPHFGICGGCAVQHWRTDSYRAWKRGLVVAALRQAGLEVPVGDLVDAHGAGRRRAVLHARGGTREIVEVGFAALRSHQIVGIDHCPVLAPAMSGAIRAAWAIAETLKPKRKPLDIHVTATEGGLDIDVRGTGPLDLAAMTGLAALAEEHRLARLTRHGELVLQRAEPVLMIGRASLVLPPGAFLQATQAGEEALAALVIEHAGTASPVADLFAGVGPFALRLAERGRVSAIDNNAPALAALAQAAARTPGLKPIATECRDLFRRPLLAAELNRFAAVVFDPPRQGAQAQAAELARSTVRNVIAVSCNSGTFARDAAALVGGGYRLAAVMPVDQFRYSSHVELVARFEK